MRLVQDPWSSVHLFRLTKQNINCSLVVRYKLRNFIWPLLLHIKHHISWKCFMLIFHFDIPEKKSSILGSQILLYLIYNSQTQYWGKLLSVKFQILHFLYFRYLFSLYLLYFRTSCISCLFLKRFVTATSHTIPGMIVSVCFEKLIC